jgi:hypothetical protein
VTRGRFQKCRRAWCAECFRSHDLDFFEVKLPRDFNGASLAEVEDEKRFKVARPGDHLCCSFQCPNCQSQNIRGRDIDRTNARDVASEVLVIRATLDAFWAHATSTVNSHVSEVRFLSRYGEALGFEPMPSLGPFPLYKHGGMLEAIMLLMRSSEKGRKKATVQFGTARKIRSTLTRLWECSPDSGQDLVLSSASRKGRYIATLCPSETRWYEMFTLGICARMGDIVSQDRAYTLEIIHELLKSYEEEWANPDKEMPLKTLCSCMFLLVSSLGGMRGFEVMWTDLAALIYDLEYCEDCGDMSVVSWPIVGRFKSHNGLLGCYMIPIAGKTKSGINFFRWTQRFVGRLVSMGRRDGWAFQRADGTRAKAMEYMEDIYQRLENVQASTSLIDPQTDVRTEFGAQRSGRRFLTTHATNKGVKPHIIELQCRWQTDRARGERSVNRSMIHLYSEVRNMKTSLMQPSLEC